LSISDSTTAQSLLFSKVFDLVCGGKASSSLIRNRTTAISFVEVSLKLCNTDHVRLAQQRLEGMDLNAEEILGVGRQDIGALPVTLTLKRSFTPPSSSGKNEFKSLCYINNKQVPLKALRKLVAPLLPIVNAPLAASALRQPASRIAMIDAGVPSDILQRVSEYTRQYKSRRKDRETLERDLAPRSLPVSMSWEDDRDKELLRHWINELDSFEKRSMDMISSLCPDHITLDSEIGMLLDTIGTLDWMSVEDSKIEFSSKLYASLIDLDEMLKDFDRRMDKASASLGFIGSLSSPNSARTALEKARQLLLDVAGKQPREKSKVSLATERVHDMLNEIEQAVSDCVDFLEDEDKGLLAAVRNERNVCAISSEALGEFILEWKGFARKHGISPYALPLWHRSLRRELDNNVEAKDQLLKAIAAEAEALVALKGACGELRLARIEIAAKLSEAVSARLPSLGMDSRFLVRVQTSDRSCHGAIIGVDEIDFFLLHENTNYEEGNIVGEREGKLEAVASAGEKARIILAIECEVPGSIRALCGSVAVTDNASTTDDDLTQIAMRPVAVIYDEIDAHVGGLAAVSIAQMLSQQSQACQVVSITHSASIAATADMHICVKRLISDGHAEVTANPVMGEARLQELARMASGDMAVEEAEAFAGALLRDARHRNRQASKY
jgi:DNA repair ATPase RecN